MNESFVEFKKIIWEYFEQNNRSFDWRYQDDPYRVFISEVMLQQTQTTRVVLKYPSFIKRFSNFQELAHASLKDVLQEWQGLGYNRRGMYLHQAAQKVINEYQGILSDDPSILVQLPGIGKATAASIVAFAFNKPTVFIETNIRTVFIHFFFAGQDQISDYQIFPLVEQTVDKKNPREWYYALMDYGVFLKKHMINPSRKSRHYTKQSKFEGSDRQIRGLILKILTNDSDAVPLEKITSIIKRDHARILKIIDQMENEKLINKSIHLNDAIYLTVNS